MKARSAKCRQCALKITHDSPKTPLSGFTRASIRHAAAGEEGRGLGGGRPVPVERAVAAAERDELVVRALLDDAAVLEDDDEVGAADRREPVGDDERRPSREESPQRELDAALGPDVDARGRVV